MDQRLIPSQTQKLILSPQIRQYLKLLQMPLAELEQAVETELAENPLLEEKAQDRAEEGATLPDTPLREREKAPEELGDGESFDRFEEMDENLQSAYETPRFSLQDRT